MRMAVHLLLENKTNRKMEYDGSPPTTCGDDGKGGNKFLMTTSGMRTTDGFPLTMAL